MCVCVLGGGLARASDPPSAGSVGCVRVCGCVCGRARHQRGGGTLNNHLERAWVWVCGRVGGVRLARERESESPPRPPAAAAPAPARAPLPHAPTTPKQPPATATASTARQKRSRSGSNRRSPAISNTLKRFALLALSVGGRRRIHLATGPTTASERGVCTPRGERERALARALREGAATARAILQPRAASCGTLAKIEFRSIAASVQRKRRLFSPHSRPLRPMTHADGLSTRKAPFRSVAARGRGGLPPENAPENAQKHCCVPRRLWTRAHRASAAARRSKPLFNDQCIAESPCAPLLGLAIRARTRVGAARLPRDCDRERARAQQGSSTAARA